LVRDDQDSRVIGKWIDVPLSCPGHSGVVKRSEIIPVTRDQDSGLPGGKEELIVVEGSRQSLLCSGCCLVTQPLE
jgi:hypothetical protein